MPSIHVRASKASTILSYFPGPHLSLLTISTVERVGRILRNLRAPKGGWRMLLDYATSGRRFLGGGD